MARLDQMQCNAARLAKENIDRTLCRIELRDSKRIEREMMIDN